MPKTCEVCGYEFLNRKRNCPVCDCPVYVTGAPGERETLLPQIRETQRVWNDLGAELQQAARRRAVGLCEVCGATRLWAEEECETCHCPVRESANSNELDDVLMRIEQAREAWKHLTPREQKQAEKRGSREATLKIQQKETQRRIDERAEYAREVGRNLARQGNSIVRAGIALSLPFAALGYSVSNTFGDFSSLLSIFGDKTAHLVGGCFSLAVCSLGFAMPVAAIMDGSEAYALVLVLPLAIIFLCAIRGSLIGSLNAVEEKSMADALLEASGDAFFSRRAASALLAIAGAMGLIAFAATAAQIASG